MEPNSGPPHVPHLPRSLYLAAAVGAVLFLMAITGVIFVRALRDDILAEVARSHFRFLVGTPMCAMTALVVVNFLQSTSGAIEFEAPFGFKFKGASGPVVLWVLVFLACVAGMVALW